MREYRSFRPTPFDSHISIDDDEETRENWLVLDGVSRTRDNRTDPLIASNWQATLDALSHVDPDNRDHELHCFGHWGPGWFEIILVRPETPCASVAERIEARLSDYPVLDESDMSEREYALYEETWSDKYAIRELLRGEPLSDNAVDLLVNHPEPLRELYERCADSHFPSRYECDNEGCRLMHRDFYAHSTREDLAAALREARKLQREARAA